jgi:probable HAF family extracellular repeat protein
VVGYANVPTGGNHAFLYSGGSMHDLGVLAVGGQSFARGINDNGVAVGTSNICSDFGGYDHAVMFVNGEVQDLGTLGGAYYSTALGINNIGQIVGNSNSAAFLYSNGVMRDLNNLIDPTLGWSLRNANAINDFGQIVGRSIDANGITHAFLLTPTPEPASLVLLCFGSLALVRKKRR